MLRASSRHTGRPVHLRSIVDPFTDSLIPAGAELLAFTDAAVLRDTHEMPVARKALLRTAGPEATLRAAAVAGNFEMMNRLLDAFGVRVGAGALRIADELGVEIPRHLHPQRPPG